MKKANIRIRKSYSNIPKPQSGIQRGIKGHKSDKNKHNNIGQLFFIWNL